MDSLQCSDNAALVDRLAGKICFQDFDLDCTAQTASYRGKPLSLTGTEFDLLLALLTHAGSVLSREDLSNRILLRPFHPLARSLDMLVSRLRRKLRLHDNPGRAIKTVRGNGYMFEDLRHKDAFSSMRPSPSLHRAMEEARMLAG